MGIFWLKKRIGKNVNLKISANGAECRLTIDGIEIRGVTGTRIEHNLADRDHRPRLVVTLCPKEITVTGKDVGVLTSIRQTSIR
jgi:hypothetical protein